jgi:hypothetical protein
MTSLAGDGAAVPSPDSGRGRIKNDIGSERMHRIERAVVLFGVVLVGLGALPVAVMAQAYDGYTLFSPNNGTDTYLVDMDNTQVYHWTHNRQGGYSVYLLEDGNIIRPAVSDNSNLNGGAAAGLVQKVNPSNVLVWQYSYSNNTIRSHHDICPMPNGNVLLIAWEVKTSAQAVQAGLDHTAVIWPDHIVEVQPSGTSGGTIVWQWHAWDHLIQDHDATKDNYGVVANHPELLDINLGDGGGIGGGDWMHLNAISYNPDRDEIVVSSHTLDELYVIDHSTTTAEAAGHTGGNSGMGGDILYRWGCPSNYDAPGEPYFNVVHCANWIPAGYPGAGNILAFNNREFTGSSIIAEIVPPHDEEGHYYRAPGSAFGPAAPVWTFSASWFYTTHLGGCQRLPNGNTLVTESLVGNMVEVDVAGNTEWSYARGGEIARSLRYGMSYPGLAALGLVTDVAPGGDAAPLRLDLGQNYPNPFGANTTIRYELPAPGPVSLRLYDTLGREVGVLVDRAETAGLQSIDFDGSRLPNGVYFCRLKAGGLAQTKKLVVRR